MKREAIDFLKSLDPEEVNGTVQSVLLNPNLHAIGFEQALKFLIMRTLEEKEALIKTNTAMCNYLSSIGHLNNKALGLEE